MMRAFPILTAALNLLVTLSPQFVYAEMNDEPLLLFIGVDELEVRDGDTEHLVAWDADAWFGTTRDRLIVRSEGEIEHGETGEFETVLGYSRAVSPYWNMNLGWHGDWQLNSARHWGMIELEGIAPGFIDTRLSLLASSGGRYSVRASTEIEWWLTHRWQLVPGLKIDWYSDKDPGNELGSGFANLDASLRLKYQLSPRLLPYAGVQLSRWIGNSADLARLDGRRPRSLSVVAGLSFWF